MIFLFQEKLMLRLKYLVFCVFAKSTEFKICDVIIDIATYHRHCLFLLSPKHSQIEIWSNTSLF